MRDARHSRRILTWEIVQVALESFSLNKIRFALTALGVVIGTASLILVVTIGLTGKQYVLNQIQAIGANMIYAFYEGEGTRTASQQDFLTVDDVRAVEQQVNSVVAASPMVTLNERIPVGGGKEREIQVLGVDPDYRAVRNLTVLAGRFFDDDDSRARNKVAVITYKLADRLYNSQEGALGHSIKISGLPFTIVGTFRETVETFGQSELASESIVIPYTAARYFVASEAVNQMYFSVSDASEVPRATAQIHAVLQSRHRPESVYRVENLSQLISVADRTADALTVVLLLIATVTLIVSGVGIMNIMLATVTSRTREIGIRKAIGATNWEIKLQFLAEASLISLAGGVIGTVIGLALPLSVRFLTDFRIPISGLSAIIAIGVSSLVGIIFGTVPATRAAQLDPIESLRYE
jgi:putative ABC transport system permease protein